MSELFDPERLRTFVKKASRGNNLGQGKLFDISDTQESEDMAIGLLTEYVTEGDDAELKKAKIAAGYLTRTIDDKILGGMHTVLRQEKPRIDRIASGVASMTYDIAGVAARGLRKKLEAEPPKATIQNGDFLHQSTGNLIRGLFENGIISPGHATALLVYFRLDTPKYEPPQYQQLLAQVQRDLLTRMRTIEQNKTAQLWPVGKKIIRAYIERHEIEAITLELSDAEDIEQVNATLVQLYTLRQDELLPAVSMHPQHDKYKDTATPIDGFDD